jgi:hypothetical protein
MLFRVSRLIATAWPSALIQGDGISNLDLVYHGNKALAPIAPTSTCE